MELGDVSLKTNSRAELISAFGMLERSAVKVARCDLRGVGNWKRYRRVINSKTEEP
jgi:hypothetical protein